MSLIDSRVSLIVKDGVSDGNDHAYCDTTERESSDSWRPAASLLVDDREGCEHHVQRSVNDRHVD